MGSTEGKLMYQSCLDGHGCSTPIHCRSVNRCELTYEEYGAERPPPPAREVEKGDPPLGRFFDTDINFEIIDAWSVVDKWWTPFSSKHEFVIVKWYGRALTFFREAPDKVWRIWQKT